MVKGYSQLCGTKHRGAQLARGDGVRVRGKALDLLCHHRLGHDRLLHGAGEVAGGRGGWVLGTKPCPATKILEEMGGGGGMIAGTAAPISCTPILLPCICPTYSGCVLLGLSHRTEGGSS